MKKLIKVLSFISLGLMILSCFLVILCTVFRRPLTELFLSYGADDLKLVIPAGTAVSMVLQLGCALWLSIFASDHRFGIWAEILPAAGLALVAPLLNRVLSAVQSRVIVRMFGYLFMNSLSMISALWSYATIFTGFAVSLALVVCGMSIAYKRLFVNDRQL